MVISKMTMAVITFQSVSSPLSLPLQGPVVDLSARGMQKLDPSFTCSEDTHTLILDRNHIMKLDHLERSPGLQQVAKPLDFFAQFSPFIYRLIA